MQFIEPDDLSIGFDNGKMDSYKFASLDIEWFDPPAGLLRKRMQAGEVMEYTARDIFPPPGIMITAVMIASVAVIGRDRVRSWNAHTRFGVCDYAASRCNAGLNQDHEFHLGPRHAVHSALHDQPCCQKSWRQGWFHLSGDRVDCWRWRLVSFPETRDLFFQKLDELYAVKVPARHSNAAATESNQ
jgi:hypothetical protein